MKLSTFLLLSCAFTGIAGNVSSQNARVTLNENNVAVSKILNSIESQTDYLFIYNKNNVNVSRTASVKAKEKTVDKVLSELFNGTNITYEMEGKHIVLSMKKKTLPK
ncbi:MAG: STN domain-containing protein [Parabacteroides sp.]